MNKEATFFIASSHGYVGGLRHPQYNTGVVGQKVGPGNCIFWQIATNLQQNIIHGCSKFQLCLLNLANAGDIQPTNYVSLKENFMIG